MFWFQPPKKLHLFKKCYGITIFIAIKETYLFCDIINRIVIGLLLVINKYISLVSQQMFVIGWQQCPLGHLTEAPASPCGRKGFGLLFTLFRDFIVFCNILSELWGNNVQSRLQGFCVHSNCFLLLICNLFLWRKAKLSAAITPVFSITWSFKSF